MGDRDHSRNVKNYGRFQDAIAKRIQGENTRDSKANKEAEDSSTGMKILLIVGGGVIILGFFIILYLSHPASNHPKSGNRPSLADLPDHEDEQEERKPEDGEDCPELPEEEP